jgi:hypothetical protein
VKKILLLLSIIAFAMAACQQTTEPVDIEAEETLISEMLITFMDHKKNQEFDSLVPYLSEDVLGCGSDPGGFFNKEEIIEGWHAMEGENFPDMSLIGGRVVKVAPDGKSAIAVEQMNLSLIPNIPCRTVYYLLKTEGKWVISFFSTSLVPMNKDLEAIIKAVTVEEEPVQE